MNGWLVDSKSPDTSAGELPDTPSRKFQSCYKSFVSSNRTKSSSSVRKWDGFHGCHIIVHQVDCKLTIGRRKTKETITF